jgi:single-strand DNA-binding protein
MNALKNKVQLIGNVGKDPEIKEITGGRKLARFSVATTESYENAQGVKVNDTQWHNLVAWGKVAEIAEKRINKGSQIAIAGKLVSRVYNDKEGNKKYITEVEVSEIIVFNKN